MLVATADVGGSKTTVRLSDGDREISRSRGAGAPVRPGRALTTAASVADQIRQTIAKERMVRVDAIVVGAAGAGNPADAEEIRLALVGERIADRVIVTTDVMLALEALGSPAGGVLLAGTGSIAVGRTGGGELVRQGGLGWRMGDEGGGYWIGTEALRAVGRAHDGREPSTALTEKLLAAARAAGVRRLAGWAAVAEPREVAGLVPAVLEAAAAGDAAATAIVAGAAQHLAALVLAIGTHFPGGSRPPLAMTGGLLPAGGPIRTAVTAKLAGSPFVVLVEPLDPLLGGPRLAAAPR